MVEDARMTVSQFESEFTVKLDYFKGKTASLQAYDRIVERRGRSRNSSRAQRSKEAHALTVVPLGALERLRNRLILRLHKANM